ncbi:uncharacterized protein LOC128225086 [Mya arenaria]|uniref:uncharacterized protein LOC128225086 n=1 Tax=Mya arenaria TaxID=6604 RepID=UPI0022E08D41|nr:uncharacterized protein LOC128225086 [Mya arenaria]
MWELSLVLFLVSVLTTVKGYTQCGRTSCYGSGAYCCSYDSSECCWDTISVYSYWWFWFIWFWVVFFIISCSICICIRRRRQAYAQPRYVIVDNQQTYGTVAPPGYQYNSGYNVTANVPTQNAVPASAPAYQEKPPDYETVAGQRK